jgi:hypothetical protein
MYEDTMVALAHNEAVDLVWVLGLLSDWLAPGGEAYELLDEHLGVVPGVFGCRHIDDAVDCVVVSHHKLSERVGAARAAVG